MIKGIRENLQLPQIIILGYLGVLIVLSRFANLSYIELFNESLVKWVMNGVLVLSLIPMINVGAGRNFGLPIGISAGLVGICVAIEYRFTDWTGFIVAVAVSTLIAVVFGYVYSLILNNLKGNEEIVGTFAGFSFIPIMNFFWTLAPFQNRQMLYPVGGEGLRPRINLGEYFGGILDNLFMVNIGRVSIPLGLIMAFMLIGYLVHLLGKTRLGIGMSSVAENEAFSKLGGLSVNRYRMYGIVISTIIAGIGIIFYSQSYGFVQLYDGPFMMAFPAISAILIGGASRKKATVFNAMVGTYLYQTTFLLSVPVSNALFIPEMAEIVRMIVTNGIILYAFLYEGVKSKNEEVQ